MSNIPDLLGGSDEKGDAPTAAVAASETAAPATESLPPSGSSSNDNSNSNKAWRSMMGEMAGSLVQSARSVKDTSFGNTSNAANNNNNNTNSTNSNNSTSPNNNNFFTSLSNNVSSLTSTIAQSTTSLGLKNTLPDKTTASQVLMFRQLLHTSCRPGLRLSRKYEGTAAQKAVMHMPWWERGIEGSGRMVISYDNLITRLWISGAILEYQNQNQSETLDSNNYDCDDNAESTPTTEKPIDTLINDKGLPPIPHPYWVHRLGFQQDDPVTDFRSGGVLSLAMLVHIVESCPLVHARFVPKRHQLNCLMDSNNTITIDDANTANNDNNDNITTSLEQILLLDASVLPFGITCINITDMLAKFLLFSKSIDKMDALLSSKPFWKLFMDSPNAMLVLQEVSLDLLCDVVVEIGRERRLNRLMEEEQQQQQRNNKNNNANNNGNDNSKDDAAKKAKSMMHNNKNGKVTVFDFSEIMQRTEKRVEHEVLGAGPQTVEELRAVARRVKSKYLMRIQSKEKYLMNSQKGGMGGIPGISMPGAVAALPSKESVRNVTSSVMGGMGGLMSSMWKSSSKNVGGGSSGGGGGSEDGEGATPSSTKSTSAMDVPATPQEEEIEISYNASSPTITQTTETMPTTPTNPFAATESSTSNPKTSASQEDISAISEAFDLLGGDFDGSTSPTQLLGMEDGDIDGIDLLDAMDQKLDPAAAFTIDDDDF